MLLAESTNTLTQGEGGLVGVLVLAVLGLVGIALQVRRAGRDSTTSERIELLKQYREERESAIRERDAANTRAAASERRVDDMQEQVLDARTKQREAEYERQQATDQIRELTEKVAALQAEVASLKNTVQHKIPEPSEESHGPANASDPS